MTHKLFSSNIRLVPYFVVKSLLTSAIKFQCVINVQSDSEDGHFYLGRYYDRLKSVLASDRLTKSAYVLLFQFCIVVSK